MSKSVAVGLLALILLATYSNHFQNSFHFDDAHTIVNNAAIRELKNIPIFFKDARSFSSLPSNQSYRPLVSTLLAIDYRLSGLDPFWYHLSSLALFIALILLLAFVIYCLIDNVWITFVAASLYGLHPANADTVNYIIASAEIISTLGIVSADAMYFAFPSLRCTTCLFCRLQSRFWQSRRPQFFPFFWSRISFCFRNGDRRSDS